MIKLLATALIFISNLSISQELLAQLANQSSKNYYKTSVVPLSDQSKTYGYLTELKAQSVVLSQFDKSGSIIPYKSIEIPIKDIKKLKFLKDGKTSKNLTFFTLAGALFGSLIGYTSEDDPRNCWVFCSKGERALAGGLYGGLGGLAIGGIIGTIKTKFMINGKQQTFSERMEELEKYRRIVR